MPSFFRRLARKNSIRSSSSPIQEESWASFHRKHGSKPSVKSPSQRGFFERHPEISNYVHRVHRHEKYESNLDEDKRRARMEMERRERRRKRYRKLAHIGDRLRGAFGLYREVTVPVFKRYNGGDAWIIQTVTVEEGLFRSFRYKGDVLMVFEDPDAVMQVPVRRSFGCVRHNSE